MSRIASVMIAVAMLCAGHRSAGAVDFLSRNVCTAWAGQCQTYGMTVGDLADLCSSKGTADWSLKSETHAILRCDFIDEATDKHQRMSFVFDAMVRPTSIKSDYLTGPRSMRWVRIPGYDGKPLKTGLTLRSIAQACKAEDGEAEVNAIGGGRIVLSCSDVSQSAQAVVSALGLNGERASQADIVNIVSMLAPAAGAKNPHVRWKIVLSDGSCDTCGFEVRETIDGKGKATAGEERMNRLTQIEATADIPAADEDPDDTKPDGPSLPLGTMLAPIVLDGPRLDTGATLGQLRILCRSFPESKVTFDYDGKIVTHGCTFTSSSRGRVSQRILFRLETAGGHLALKIEEFRAGNAGQEAALPRERIVEVLSKFP